VERVEQAGGVFHPEAFVSNASKWSIPVCASRPSAKDTISSPGLSDSLGAIDVEGVSCRDGETLH
jgi:hypothetical protein